MQTLEQNVSDVYTIGVKYQWRIRYWSKMSVTHGICGRCEIAVTDDIYIRNRSSNNIAAQTYITY
jgi:hypothetical protein